jgi:hypothetical protein
MQFNQERMRAAGYIPKRRCTMFHIDEPESDNSDRVNDNIFVQSDYPKHLKEAIFVKKSNKGNDN